MQETLTIYQQKHPITVKMERVAFYQQAQVIEAVYENEEMYYLFFYKYRFLTAVKTKKLRRKSFLERVFKNGMIYNAPHPLLEELPPVNHQCRVVSFTSLLKKLDTTYSPLEKAYILTFFESFISKKKLYKEITSIYYDYRRNGQLFYAYQIIRVLKDFAPKQSLVKQLLSDVHYYQYAKMYEQNSVELWKRDSIHAEKLWFQEKENEEYFTPYIQQLKNEKRTLDLIVLQSWKLITSPTEVNYKPLLTSLATLKEKNRLLLLQHIGKEIPDFFPIQRDLFYYYVKIKDLEMVVYILTNVDFNISKIHVDAICELIHHLEYDSNLLAPHMVEPLIKPIRQKYPDQVEMYIKKLIVLLLRNYDIEEVSSCFSEFSDCEVVEKLMQIKLLHQDLDHLQSLGELYFEFKQMNKAIECFSFEMELRPKSVEPVQWLSKSYRELGLTNESEAYRKLGVSLSKNA